MSSCWYSLTHEDLPNHAPSPLGKLDTGAECNWNKEIENVCLQVSYQLIRVPDEWVGVKENWPHRTPGNKLRKTSHRGHLGKDPHPAEQATGHVLYWVPDVELSEPQNV